MRRFDVIFLVLMAFLTLSLLVCIFCPLIGVIILTACFSLFVGLFLFAIMALWYLKRK